MSHGRWLAAVLLFICLGAVYAATQIQYRDGTRDIFVSSSQEYTQYQRHVEDFPQSDANILIVAKSPEPFDRKQLELLRGLVLDGQLIEGIEIAISIFSQQQFDPKTGEYRTLLADDLSSYPDITQPMRAAQKADPKLASLINGELNETVIIFSVEDHMTDLDVATPLLTELNDLIGKVLAEGNLSLAMTGLIPMRHHIVSQLKSEQVLFSMVGGILGSLITLLLFRSIWIGALNGIAPSLALLLTIGSFGLLGFEMNVISNTVTVLILVLTMADCIHMTHELRKNAAAGMRKREAIGSMMRAIGPPSVLTSLTTIIALASLFYSDSEMIRSFSVAGITGMLIALFSVIFIHPLVYALVWDYPPVQKALTQKSLPQMGSSSGLNRITKWLLERRYAVVTGSIILCGFLLVQFLPVQTSHKFSEYLHEQDPIVLAMLQVEAIAGPTQSVDVVLKKNGEGALVSPTFLEQLEKAHDKLETKFQDHTVVSLASVQKLLRKNNPEATVADLKKILEQLPERTRDDLTGRHEDGFKISVMIRDTPSSQTRILAAQINQELAKLNLEGLRAEAVTGLGVLAATQSDRMIRELTISFLIAAFACPLLIAVWFRQWRYGVAAVIPNILPILMVGAWLMFSGWKLQFTSALALSVAFGVAVDDTIHVLNRLQIKRANHPRSFTVQQLPQIMEHVAPALITTSVVLSVGLIATLSSAMPTVAYFGGLCILIFILALGADILILLPMIAVLGFGGPSRQRTAST
ncbi:efflux RND transporter permease subunit [Parasphingorhabdus sp.]|uniref:efflux RND transporter permease subunit n=1 Tax=Parasphingorhabdus sp. TaxID=2709688 RepID=UPI003A8CF5EE